MATYLFKTEPGEYSFDDLVRDKRTAWTGVSNAQALISLRLCKKGDEVLVYHTGDVKAVVGLAKVVKSAYPDPAAGDPKLVAVDIAPVRALPRAVTLAAIKGDERFKEFLLVRNSRLSVMEVPPEIDAAIRGMGGL